MFLASTNTSGYYNTTDITSLFSINKNSSTKFYTYSNIIKKNKSSGRMGSYDTVRCKLQSRKLFVLYGRITITELRVGNCYMLKFGQSKYVYINSVYILGEGISHRFSGPRNGENIFFPQLAFFYQSTQSTFVY